MLAFENTWKQMEQKVMVYLLTEIKKNLPFTPRGLASELGIAVGLMNQYFKNYVAGWVRISPSFSKTHHLFFNA